MPPFFLGASAIRGAASFCIDTKSYAVVWYIVTLQQIGAAWTFNILESCPPFYFRGEHNDKSMGFLVGAYYYQPSGYGNRNLG